MRLIIHRIKRIPKLSIYQTLLVTFLIICAWFVVRIDIWKPTTHNIDPNTTETPKVVEAAITIEVSGNEEVINCYNYSKSSAQISEGSIIFLDDIIKTKKQPLPGKSIFLLETSCSNNSLIHLNARQACAIEAAAKLNPNRDVFVLFASAIGFTNESSSPGSILNILQSYPNIYMRSVNLWSFAAGTPVHDWLSAGQLFLSTFLTNNVSNFLRFLTLYKFGGTYIDLDVVVQKNLDSIEENFAGAENETSINNAVMNFDHNGIGHEIVKRCLEEFKQNFNGNIWAHNGPVVITRVIQQYCRTKFAALMTRDRCGGFNVHPTSSFYPITWQSRFSFFNPDSMNETLEMIQAANSIHFWNSATFCEQFKRGTKAAYGIIAEKNCPKIYHSSGEYF